MGMIQTILRKVPEDQTKRVFLESLYKQVQNKLDNDEDGYEGYEIFDVTEENFEDIWDVQETFKDTTEIKEKYRKVSKQGNLIAVEIDW
jgi:hypothetical protein